MTGACDFDCVAPARVAIHCSRSGLMFLSFVATTIQLGLLLTQVVVMTVLSLLAALNTCDCAIRAASSTGRSAASSCNLTQGGRHELRRLCSLFMVSLQRLGCLCVITACRGEDRRSYAKLINRVLDKSLHLRS